MKKLGLSLSTALGAALFPALALAHPGHGGFESWSDGFNHPLHGLDHLAAMVAVGLWAAQQRGHAMFALPVTFLAVMALGGLAGVWGADVPGVEPMIGLSIVVLGFLVIRRQQTNALLGGGVVGLFAFFHGYAHGAEMPSAAGLATFGLGFLVATALLHGVGFAVMRAANAAAVRSALQSIKSRARD